MTQMTHLSRRGFLRGTGATLAAAPWLIPAAALAQEATPAASARITMGFIGVGGMGRGNLGAFMGFNEVQVVAVCDVDAKSAAAAREDVEKHYAAAKASGEWKGCAAYGDFRELLARDDIDAVCVATPDHWHALIAIAAAKSGKDVYCEKPMSLTIREARAMATAVRRYGRVFQTGSQQRSDHKFRFACELVRNGRLGRIDKIHVNVGGPPELCYLPAEPTPATLDWDLWLGPAPVRAYHHVLCPLDNYDTWPQWRSYWDFCGGGMTDWGAHHFDIAQWALGMDDSGPLEILPPEGSPEKLLTYRYANGTRVFHGGASAEAGVEIHGTEGRIGVDRGVLVAKPESLLRTTWGPHDVRLYESQDHVGNWLECIRTRRETICPALVGHRSVSVCHLGNLAYRLKRPLAWDPVRERVVDDASADRFLARPMRAPWVV
jgi:predicted dehydrogenase